MRDFGWPGCTALREFSQNEGFVDLCWPGKAMEHNRTTKYRTKLHSHQVMCLHSLSKGEVIEGKSTKIAQIRDQVIDAQPHTD